MKKIALLFIIMLMPMFAEADGYRLTIDGVCYFLTEKGATVMPVKSNKYAGNVNIPATIVYQNKSYPVYRIYDEAFRECEDLLSVTIGGNSIKIGDYAFYRCSKLTSVVIPDTIEEIGMGAFTFCKNLTYVTPPKSLKKIEDSCFGSCSSLKYFHLPANIETIGKFVFSGCTSLKDIYCYATTVPNTADQAFDNYPQITLHVPAGSVDDYRSAAEWKNFKNIVALPNQENEREINEQNFPDENFRNYVLSTAIDRNQNKVLDDDEILCVKEIDVHYKKIASLKGIEHFKELHKLTCYQNDLTELDLSVCPRLDTLNCAANKLKALNLSNCSKLKWIRCDQNQLSELDVSACTELELLICSSNKITTLDVSACRELIDFECHYNNLTKLDVSNNKKLVKLYCNYNQLTELDLSKNTKLEKCSCNRNRITKLILSKDNVLNALNCSTNQLYGAAMDHIVDNLNYQQQEGFLCVFNADDKDLEKNIITTKQVDALNAKGWIVFQWIYSDYSIYKGSAPTDDYHPFVKEGKVWNCQVEGYEAEKVADGVYGYYFQTAQYSLRISGDTIIDGITYKKVYKESEIIDKILVQTDPAEAIQSMEKNVHLEKNVTTLYPEFMREEGKTVYGRWKDWSDQEFILYDFSVAEGEKLSNKFPLGEVLINSISTITAHGQSFRCFHLGPNDGYEPLWVEGIGHPGGPFLSADAMMNDGKSYTLLSCYEDGECIFTEKDFNNPPVVQMAYRPFIEEGKVWKVGAEGSGNLVQWVKYYYFDGDTIIGGKTCKQMMCEQFVNPDYVDYDYVMRYPQLSYVGAWYEEDKKVYFYNANNKRFTLWYDFSADANDTIQILGQSYVIGSKQTGGMKGFKGVYRDVMMVWDEEQNNYNTTWLEGVGSVEGPLHNVYIGNEYYKLFLMSCTVGDEVIYLNDEYEDGATPDEMNARKQRIDFTHTVKIRPKAPMKRAEEQSLYGEYNERQLGINLNPLDEAYLVRITDESGKTFYEKTVNAGSIVGLNIDISAYAKGRYIVTVENSQESFTGVFDAQTQGIEENVRVEKANNASIYNLHGQRISTLQKGLNIVNGQKVYVK